MIIIVSYYIISYFYVIMHILFNIDLSTFLPEVVISLVAALLRDKINYNCMY